MVVNAVGTPVVVAVAVVAGYFDVAVVGGLVGVAAGTALASRQ